ncbi:MAG: hypothetical protein ABI891_03605 [Acidobacteriota bacterium]
MWKTILYFLLINFVVFILIIGIYAIGFEYDKANKLYPETIQLSYDSSISEVYGQRWVRFAQISIVIGLLTDVVLGFIIYRKKVIKEENKFLV